MGQIPDDAVNVLSLGAKLRDLRNRQGLSREVVAVRAGLGSATVRRIEEGTHDPRLGTVTAIASVLGVSVSDLMAESQSGDGTPERVA